MSKIELPPLPPVVAHMHSNGDVCTERRPEISSWPVSLVTWPEVRARDRQIVELCASLCDQMRAVSAVSYETGAACAAAIRALLDEKKENE